MHFRDLHRYCMAKPGAEESFSFGDDVVLYKVGGRIFALTNLEGLPQRLLLKCDPERAVRLRERYPAVEPAFHPVHWNGIELDGSIPDRTLRAWIDHSYQLVVRKLSRSRREALAARTRPAPSQEAV